MPHNSTHLHFTHFECSLKGVFLFHSPSWRKRTVRQERVAEMIVMIEGVYIAKEIEPSPGESIRAEAGDVVFWPAGVRRVEENDPAKPLRCFAIFLQWPESPGDMPRVVGDTEGIMRFLAAQLIAIKETRVPFPPAVSNAFLGALLAEYIRRAFALPDPLEGKVVDFLSRNRAASFTLEALARFVGLERHHFGRTFKKRTGYTPMEYVRCKRLEWARDLMHAMPNLSLNEIACRVGVRNDAELRRQFHRYTGMGVRVLRKMIRRGLPLPPLIHATSENSGR